MDDDRKLILETGQYRVWIGQKGTIFIRILKRTSVKQLMILIGDIYQNNLSDSEKRSVICTLYFPVSLYRENKETLSVFARFCETCSRLKLGIETIE